MNPIIKNLHKHMDDNWTEKFFLDTMELYLLVLKGLYKSHPEEARFISQFLFRCYYWLEDDHTELRNQIKTFHKEILITNQIDYGETDKELTTSYEGADLLHPWNCTRCGDYCDEQYIEKYKSKLNLKK